MSVNYTDFFFYKNNNYWFYWFERHQYFWTNCVSRFFSCRN